MQSPWSMVVDQLKAKSEITEDFATWKPMEHQIPPGGKWFLWILKGGRGVGKTDAGSKWLDDHMQGPACDPRLPGGHKAIIIAPTLGDAYESCVVGPSGLKAHNPAIRTVTRKGGTYVIWPNGATARLFGASSPEDVERLRAGGNNCAARCEELAAWRKLKQCWDHMRFGLRLGTNPQVVASTTPKPRKHLKMLLAAPNTVVTTAATKDNPHLSHDVRDALYETYQGTRLGKQELEGQMLSDVPGSIATQDEFDQGRRDSFPSFSRSIVMVDPSQTNTETSDECGITVQGRQGNEVYLVADVSKRADVKDWSYLAVDTAFTWNCGAIYYESNGSSGTTGEVLEQALIRWNQIHEALWNDEQEKLLPEERRRYQDFHVKIDKVNATLSKYDRALALQMAIQQNRWHLVGMFPQLESELTEWTPEALDSDDEEKTKKDKSPNRLDAAVHGYRVLMNIATSGPGRSMGAQVRRARI